MPISPGGWKETHAVEDVTATVKARTRRTLLEMAYGTLSVWNGATRELPDEYKNCTEDELIAHAEFKRQFDPDHVRKTTLKRLLAGDEGM